MGPRRGKAEEGTGSGSMGGGKSTEQQASLPSSVKWEFYKNLNKDWPEQSVLSWGEMREPWRGQDPGQWVREDLWESVVSVLRPEGVREPGGQVNGG